MLIPSASISERPQSSPSDATANLEFRRQDGGSAFDVQESSEMTEFDHLPELTLRHISAHLVRRNNHAASGGPDNEDGA